MRLACAILFLCLLLKAAAVIVVPPMPTNPPTPAYDLHFVCAALPTATGYWLNTNGAHFAMFQGTNAWITNAPVGITRFTGTPTNQWGEGPESNVITITNPPPFTNWSATFTWTVPITNGPGQRFWRLMTSTNLHDWEPAPALQTSALNRFN